MTAESISSRILPSSGGTTHSTYTLGLLAGKAGKGELAQRAEGADLGSGNAEPHGVWRQVFTREAGEPREDASTSQGWSQEEAALEHGSGVAHGSDVERASDVTTQTDQETRARGESIAPRSLSRLGDATAVAHSKSAKTPGQLREEKTGTATGVQARNLDVSSDAAAKSGNANHGASSKRTGSQDTSALEKQSGHKREPVSEATAANGASARSPLPGAPVADMSGNSLSFPDGLIGKGFVADALESRVMRNGVLTDQSVVLPVDVSDAGAPQAKGAGDKGSHADMAMAKPPAANRGASGVAAPAESAQRVSIGRVIAGRGEGSSDGLANIQNESRPGSLLDNRQEGLRSGVDETAPANTLDSKDENSLASMSIPMSIPMTIPTSIAGSISVSAAMMGEVTATSSALRSRPAPSGSSDVQIRKDVSAADAQKSAQTAISSQAAGHDSNSERVRGSIAPVLGKTGKTPTAKEASGPTSNSSHEAELAGPTLVIVGSTGVGQAGSGAAAIVGTRIAASAVKTAQGDPFVAMDGAHAGVVSPLPAGVQDALRVGYRDTELGYVELSAQQLGGSIHASLHAATEVASATLASHLGSLTNWLQERQTPVETLRVQAGGQELAGQFMHHEPGASGSGTGTAHNGGDQPGAGQSGGEQRGHSNADGRGAQAIAASVDPVGRGASVPDEAWSPAARGYAGQISVIA